ncbi:MAG TPA: hypothetical protein VLC74_02850 [Rhizomicrobium sp.]|nr:hypothetical protein [Rhizomicrobium sp.]
MTESRRQLFRISILSALGVASAALVGCKEQRHRFGPGSPSTRYQFEPIFALSADQKHWYILALDPKDSEGRLIVYQTDIANVPSRPFDTVDVFYNIPADKLTPASGWITLGNHKLKADKDGHIPQSDANNAYAIAAKWNEIPHQ